MKGLAVLADPNPLGMTAVRLHYTANPACDPTHPDPVMAAQGQRWVETQRALFPDPNDWEREYEINFHIGSGSRVFPQFLEAVHTSPLKINRNKVMYRAWDFGWHSPAMLLAHIDSRQRLCIVKEAVAIRHTTREFARLVIDLCAKDYPFQAGFEDFCDPAGQQSKSIESERSERRDIDVLNGFGIYPSYEFGWSRKDGRTLIHQLLAIRDDQTPGLYVDPTGCPLLIQSFLGRYVYPETRDGRTKEEPDDETHPWADLMAALRYLVTGLHGRLGLTRRAPSVRPTPSLSDTAFMGYGTPVKR